MDKIQDLLMQNQVEFLKQKLVDCSGEIAELKKEQLECKDNAVKAGIKRTLARLEKKRRAIKDRLLLMGVKVDRRGRPKIPVEMRSDFKGNKVKLTVRITRDNYQYLSNLKASGQTSSYEMAIDFFFRVIRAMEQQSKVNE